MNTNEILIGMEYWCDYDGSMRIVCSCFIGDRIEIFPVGEIVEDEDRWGVYRIVLADGDVEPTLDEFVDVCSHYDNIRVMGQAQNVLLPVENVFVSDSALCTCNGELGDKVVVFELG